MSTNLKIAIAEPSVIIRSGLENLLKRLPGFRIQMVEIHSVESLFDSLRMHKPDVLIVNPALPGYFTLQHLKEESGCAEMKCIALLYSVSDSVLLRSYDEQINIYDSPDEIKHKLERLNAEVLPDKLEGKRDRSLRREGNDKPGDSGSFVSFYAYGHHPPP